MEGGEDKRERHEQVELRDTPNTPYPSTGTISTSVHGLVRPLMDVTPPNNGDSELRERRRTDCDEVKLELPKCTGLVPRRTVKKANLSKKRRSTNQRAVLWTPDEIIPVSWEYASHYEKQRGEAYKQTKNVED